MLKNVLHQKRLALAFGCLSMGAVFSVVFLTLKGDPIRVTFNAPIEENAPFPLCGPPSYPSPLGPVEVEEESLLGDVDPQLQKILGPLMMAVPPKMRAIFQRVGLRLAVLEQASTGPDAAEPYSISVGPSAVKNRSQFLIVLRPNQTDQDFIPRTLHQVVLPAFGRVFFDVILSDLLPSLTQSNDPFDRRFHALVLKNRLAASFGQSSPAFDQLMQTHYGANWTHDAAALQKLFEHAFHSYYCNEATRARFADRYPQAADFFRKEFACMLGRPWYEDEAWDKNCL